MSRPRGDHKDPIAGATLEVVSAMSSLNMCPKPKSNAKGEYLADVDEWAEHAMKHLTAALRNLQRAQIGQQHEKDENHRKKIEDAERRGDKGMSVPNG